MRVRLSLIVLRIALIGMLMNWIAQAWQFIQAVRKSISIVQTLAVLTIRCIHRPRDFKGIIIRLIVRMYHSMAGESSRLLTFANLIVYNASKCA